MKIYIPSHERAYKQTTWNELPSAIQFNTQLVVHTSQAANYSNFPHIAIPDIGIGKTRQWIIDNSPDPHVLMLDDDLVFATRRADDPTKFTPSTEKDKIDMFTEVDHLMKTGVVHGGIATREGGNRDTALYKFNSRALRALFYNTDVMKKHGVRFDRIKYMEDFDVALQLLTLNEASLIVNSWVHNQGGSNTDGGCSGTRTKEAQAEAAHGLKALHPDFVTVVEKTTKTAWGGGTRTDVRIQWKRAYEKS